MAIRRKRPTNQTTEVLNAVKGHQDSDYEYERALTGLVGESRAGFAEEIRDAFEATTGDTDDAYALFYALNIYYRRMKQHTELARLIIDVGNRFATRPTYPHLQSLCYVTTRQEEDAFRCASAALQRAPEHAGVLHSFASVALDRAERMETPDPALLDQAEKALDNAFKATSGAYARFYGTSARLHTLRGEYDAAEKDIDRAVDLEDQGEDWAVRIGEYEGIRQSNRMARSSAATSREQRRMLEEMRELRQSLEGRVGAVRSEAFQLLGLLGAVIAFVVSTTTIAAQLRSFDTSGRLIVLLSAAILVVYAGFGAAFGQPSRRHLLVHLTVLALGFAVGAYALYGWNPA
jgi:hypothetical protein